MIISKKVPAKNTGLIAKVSARTFRPMHIKRPNPKRFGLCDFIMPEIFQQILLPEQASNNDIPEGNRSPLSSWSPPCLRLRYLRR